MLENSVHNLSQHQLKYIQSVNSFNGGLYFISGILSTLLGGASGILCYIVFDDKYKTEYQDDRSFLRYFKAKYLQSYVCIGVGLLGGCLLFRKSYCSFKTVKFISTYIHL